MENSEIKFAVECELERLNRPHETIAYALDERAGVVYAAVRHPKGYVYAAAGYYDKKTGELDGDNFDDETTGFYPDMNKCPLFILRELSKTTDPDALEWRKKCLRRILRSRKSSMEEKYFAGSLLNRLQGQEFLL